VTAYARIEVPREGVNDDAVRVVEWLVDDGAQVEAGQPVVVVETAKSAVDIEAGNSGFVFHLAKVGSDIPFGDAVGVISPTSDRPADVSPTGVVATVAAGSGDGIVTAKARALMSEHGLTDDLFAGHQVVRASDVTEYLERTRGAGAPAERRFRGEVLDQDADWDEVLSDPRHQDLMELLTSLRKRTKARFNRHIGTGDLLHDRWELAREYGFGEGASVYDDCLILGTVTLENDSWVGPGCILDGSGGSLTVGHHVDIGAGSHLYTHNTIERALTGHRAPVFHKPTRIGNCCFIGPRSIIAPGTVLGDHCFVAAGSYVEGVFGDYSFISGNPAKQVGTVDVAGDRARLRPFTTKDG
jgi:acetyltransferase-like isoleucine patch superfamily enzyme